MPDPIDMTPAELLAEVDRLRETLRTAYPLIREHFETLVDSHTIWYGPGRGEIDPDKEDEVGRWRALVKEVRAHIEKADAR